jgi:hypothetical protein
MQIGTEKNTYDWIDYWAQYPDMESARTGWVHPGMIVTGDGDIMTTHPGEPAVLTYDRSGQFKGSWRVEAAEIHDITLVEEDGVEYLWLTDNGSKRQPELGYDYPPESPVTSGQVFKTTMEGQVIMRLKLPDLPDYKGSRCAPTETAVNEVRHGGNGDIWVADGYGEHYVHRYDKDGHYVGSINGTDGAGKFNQPHGIFVDTRKSSPEIYVADRANGRIQVFDTEGRFKWMFGEDFLTLPSTMDAHGDQLIIGQLCARLTVVDIDDNLVCHLGANDEVTQVVGWPNNKNDEGDVVPTSLLEPVKFNSPHGMAVDSEGNIYVTEWLIGGRMIKLEKVT